MMVDKALLARLPSISEQLFNAKASKKLTFEQIGKKLGRNEIWVASVFYGQAKPEASDIEKLSETLEIPKVALEESMGSDYFPDRCKVLEVPPRDPLLYRLFEIVASHGYAYKSIINEKFGDGIMSAIAFSTTIEKEMIDGDPWVKITQKGKFLPYKRF